MAFRTFPCDSEAVEGESFLRADFSLSCDSQKHKFYRVYAGIMIVVSVARVRVVGTVQEEGISSCTAPWHKHWQFVAFYGAQRPPSLF